jgi:imidazole glycerol phosphate synthase subunit HisF
MRALWQAFLLAQKVGKNLGAGKILFGEMQKMTMKQGDINLVNILTYAGTLPLIACVLSGVWPVPGFDKSLVAQTYSAVIISFLCGIHWAALFCSSRKNARATI